MSAEAVDAPSSLKTTLPWAVTLGLLLAWAYAVFTANPLGGFANGFLIAGAVMVLVSLILGRRVLP